MANVGRNDPCPCGSGKKFKKCCANAEAEQRSPEARRALEFHRLDQELAEQMLRWARKKRGAAWLREALGEYFDDFDQRDDEHQLFVPWALHHFQQDGNTVAREFSEDPRSQLSTDAREWLAAQGRAWLSVWEVLDVKPGKGLESAIS